MHERTTVLGIAKKSGPLMLGSLGNRGISQDRVNALKGAPPGSADPRPPVQCIYARSRIEEAILQRAAPSESQPLESTTSPPAAGTVTIYIHFDLLVGRDVPTALSQMGCMKC